MRSMTGYGRKTEEIDSALVSCEITTLNSKYLDMNIYVPESMRPLKIEIGEIIRKYIKRGKVDLRIEIVNFQEPPITFDEELLKKYRDELERIRQELGINQEITMEMLLNLPDILRPREIENRERILGLVEDTLKDVIEMREREGENLRKSLEEKIKFMQDEVDKIINETSSALVKKKEEIYQKLKSLSELGLSISKEDIEFLGFRGDVDEEVIRLKSHLDLLHDLINQEGPVGKKINFVLQEIMREVNTIGSKAILPGTVHRIIGIKEKVDEIKEQGMNIE